MHSGTTIVKNKDQSIPDELLHTTLEKNGTYVGMAYATEGHVHVTKIKQRVPAATIKGAHEKFKDKQIVNFFGLATDELVHMEDVQPFVLMEDEKGNPLAVAFLDGDFSQFSKNGSTHSDQYFAVEDYLKPRIAKMWKYAGGDFTKFAEELADGTFEQDVANTMVGDRGSVLILTGSGHAEVYSVATDESSVDGDWGWSSNNHEDEEEEETIVVQKDELLAALTPVAEVPVTPPKMAARPIAPTVPISPKPAAAPVTQAVSDIPQSPKLKVTDEYEILNVPSDLKGKKRSRWFRKRLDGFLPANFDKITKVKVRKETVEALAKRIHLNPKSFKEALSNGTDTTIPEKVLAITPADKPVEVVEEAPPRAVGKRPRLGAPAKPSVPTVTPAKAEPEGPVEAPGKDVSTHNLPGDKSPAVVAAPIPVIPNAQIKELQAALDRNAQRITPPEHLQQVEKPYEDFTTQINHKTITCLEDTSEWPYEFVRDFNRTNNDLISVWACEWRDMAVKLLAIQKDLDTTGTGIVTDPAHTEQPEIKEQPQVAQVSGRRRPRLNAA